MDVLIGRHKRGLAGKSTRHNDWAADAYAPNTFGSDNCVVNLVEEPKPAPKRKAATTKKKTAKA
jgi:hypothetical protein